MSDVHGLTDEQVKRETLKWINKLRRENGKGNLPRLRKGAHVNCDCPLTNSLKDAIPGVRTTRSKVLKAADTDKTLFTAKLITELPSVAQAFIYRYDNAHRYPELEWE